MKSEMRDRESGNTKGPVEHTNDYNNDISTGSVGIASTDNGASTLRELRRKRAGKTGSENRRKPML